MFIEGFSYDVDNFLLVEHLETRELRTIYQNNSEYLKYLTTASF